ncbi:N,N-dimethylformamidase beta subunit family domain-containing protein [Streptomyces sp. NPDC005953]|uniref:N,N-dimethylformamidase beta subunit family domain-containing protein n=1 Tax=Streptomyces sp. NPDC005953 TaxID=3156719 RepID=UPI0033F20227
MTAGDFLALHVSTDAPIYRVRFYRLGQELEMVRESVWQPGSLHSAPPHPQGPPAGACPATDWGWPATEFSIPPDWRTGIYLVQFIEGGPGSEDSAPLLDGSTIEGFEREFFIVRPRRPGEHSRILYKKSTFTRHAYNKSDRRDLERTASLYENPVYLDGSDGGPRGHKISLHRPGGVIDLAYWDAPFIAWLERSGYPVEYCTDLDLHENPELLSAYDLLLSVGHDEYWSQAMRLQVEEFINARGNVAFFSANTCWWRIHPVDQNSAFISDTDHQVGEEYPHLPATDQWWPPIPNGVGLPENSLTGVSFRNGGMWATSDGTWPGDRPRAGYSVQHADHWVYEGTGLRDGSTDGVQDHLGAGTPLIGYECDGTAFTYDAEGIAWADGSDGTPDSFLILGIHLLNPTHDDFHHPKLGHWNCVAREPAVTSPRAATMGVYTAGGTVFTAGTTDWPVVCGRETDAAVVRVTRNVLDRLRTRTTADR